MDSDGKRPRSLAELIPLLEDAAEEQKVLAQCRELCRWAYDMGYADGWKRGYEQGTRELQAEWPSVVASMVRGGPTYAELEERRWGPGGREHFGDPGPGDRRPRTRPS